MTTILTAFAMSLLFALALTPLAGRFGKKYCILDRPSARKVHREPIPRCGGVAIYLAFALTVCGAFLFPTEVSSKMFLHPSLPWCTAGATLVFLLGLADDLVRLRPSVKFAVQIVAASLAYAGGVRITQIYLPGLPGLTFHWLSLPATIFWFLLVINAINLIDGLDGLAAGVAFFTSLVLLTPAMMGGRYDIAFGLAALAGACMGFLRYNFNPASIFMGDSGSYFLGYSLAALSILGAMKSQASVAMLIPVLALWMPLMDAVLAPLRRFIIGHDLFKPDKGHIHHRLLQLGLTQRRAVLIMYVLTLFFGVLALLVVNARDERVGLLFAVLAMVFIFGIKKLGYLEYLARDKILGYFHDVTDVMGIKRERRTFLSHQMAIDEAAHPEEMWQRIIDALQLLKFDRAEICFDGRCSVFHQNGDYRWCGRDICDDETESEFQLLHLNLPLISEQETFGALHLHKDLSVDPISHYTLQRVEHLRRSIVRKLKAFQREFEAAPARQAGVAGMGRHNDGSRNLTG